MAQQPAVTSGAPEVHFLNGETQISWFSPETSSTEGMQDCYLGKTISFSDPDRLVPISPGSSPGIRVMGKRPLFSLSGWNFFAFCTTNCVLHTFQVLFHPYSSQGPLLCCYSNLATTALLLQQILKCDTSKGILFKGLLLLDNGTALTAAVPGEEVVTLAGQQKESNHNQAASTKIIS